MLMICCHKSCERYFLLLLVLIVPIITKYPNQYKITLGGESCARLSLDYVLQIFEKGLPPAVDTTRHSMNVMMVTMNGGSQRKLLYGTSIVPNSFDINKTFIVFLQSLTQSVQRRKYRMGRAVQRRT